MGQSNAERQAAWRQRREQRIRELERVIAKLKAENNRLRQEKPHTKRGKRAQAAGTSSIPRHLPNKTNDAKPLNRTTSPTNIGGTWSTS